MERSSPHPVTKTSPGGVFFGFTTKPLQGRPTWTLTARQQDMTHQARRPPARPSPLLHDAEVCWAGGTKKRADKAPGLDSVEEVGCPHRLHETLQTLSCRRRSLLLNSRETVPHHTVSSLMKPLNKPRPLRSPCFYHSEQGSVYTCPSTRWPAVYKPRLLYMSRWTCVNLKFIFFR